MKALLIIGHTINNPVLDLVMVLTNFGNGSGYSVDGLAI
jgi:hypothetical protein